MTTQLERGAKALWDEWATWQQFTFCGCCRGARYCGRRTKRGRWLCWPCFADSPEEARWLRREQR